MASNGLSYDPCRVDILTDEGERDADASMKFGGRGGNQSTVSQNDGVTWSKGAELLDWSIVFALFPSWGKKGGLVSKACPITSGRERQLNRISDVENDGRLLKKN